MKPQAALNHWRAEAAKLPSPNWDGERCVSPGGVSFQAAAYGPFVAWLPCNSDWVPVMIRFRETKVL